MTDEKVDRVPVWLREGFERLGSTPDKNDFMTGWKADREYLELYEYMYPHITFVERWQASGFNRFLMIPERYIHVKERMISKDVMRIEGTIKTRKNDLTFLGEVRRGNKTSWRLKEPAETMDDLVSIIEMPFEIDTESVEKCITESYGKVHRDTRDNGVLNLFISSPIVTISGSLPFETFLELSITEKDMMHQLLKEITRRNLLLIDAHFKNRNLDTIVILGGSEQCTPPMMSPESFVEYVVPYDKPIVKRLKEYGIPVQCHCHGRIKHALPGMIEIGYDSTDPVEPPPAGDVTYSEARELADGKITLLGNLEWDELECSEPGHIKKRVRNILETGTDRLILSASAGPISKISSKLADNYRAWIDTMNEFYDSDRAKSK